MPGLFDKSSSLTRGLMEAMERNRRRSEWNDRFWHWERPPSDTEEATIFRAQANVRRAVADNLWLTAEGVSVYPQGSYHNNTNVRLEADVDLRAVHPQVHVEYGTSVLDQRAADQALGFESANFDFGTLFARMRDELSVVLLV